MSTLRQPGQPRKKHHRVHAEIVDGTIRRVKECQRCGGTFICEDAPDSGYSKAGSYKGRQYFNGKCKSCESDERYERLRTDPDWAERNAKRVRKNFEAWLEKPGVRERRAQACKDYYWRRKNDPELHQRMLEDARIDRRARMERRGQKVKPYRVSTVVDNTRPIVPAGPFAQWLESYGAKAGYRTAAALAEALGIEPRRVVGLRNGNPYVSIDLVDRALLNSRMTVAVAGRDIFTLDDLYPL